jgi:hypothetical protein
MVLGDDIATLAEENKDKDEQHTFNNQMRGLIEQNCQRLLHQRLHLLVRLLKELCHVLDIHDGVTTKRPKFRMNFFFSSAKGHVCLSVCTPSRKKIQKMLRFLEMLDFTLPPRHNEAKFEITLG